MKTTLTAANTLGMTSGSVTLNRVRAGRAPRLWAASSISALRFERAAATLK
jgi:hypothetical protein